MIVFLIYIVPQFSYTMVTVGCSPISRFVPRYNVKISLFLASSNFDSLSAFQEVSASQILDHGSISFGRFAYESLSWEKRSAFTHNKCQEELEKFKFPGLVAKKKAYFEEYYKRIRAMKALQESQQTEMTLDYSGNGSISSQTREEDETTVQLEKLGDEVTDVGVVHPEEASLEVSMGKGNDCSKPLEFQSEYSHTKVIPPDSDSSGNNFDEHEQKDKASYLHQTQHLDMDTSADASLTIRIEEPNQHDCKDLYEEGVSREDSISDKNIEPDVVFEERTSCPANSKAADMEFKPISNTAPKEVTPIIRKYKDNLSVTKLKVC